MVWFVGMHAIRVYLTASYKFPRELNWVSGVFLLFLTVAMGFTGQVLRWDQNSVWTVAVGAEQAFRMPFISKLLVKIFLSGGTMGSSTLSHFFALHVFIFPGILIGILVLHLWLVLKNGISEPPVEGEPVDPKTYRQKYHEMLNREGRPFWPDAAWRDITFSLWVTLVIIGFAWWFGAPKLEKPPDPSLIQAAPHPDWYLMWYFALLALLPHRAEDWVIILLPLAALSGLLAVPFLSNKGERALKKRPWALAVVVLVVSTIGAFWYEGTKEPWTPHFEATPVIAREVGADSEQLSAGVAAFNARGCLYCHKIAGHGGDRGPDLTEVGKRLTHDQITIRIINGGYNMPAYAGNITPKELADLTAFLESRK
jgi:ubiquinol-cytochrome c reductase cytochrome b subunit